MLAAIAAVALVVGTIGATVSTTHNDVQVAEQAKAPVIAQVEQNENAFIQ
ncbi:MAG: hypothetical protein PVH47_05900 [Thiohalocapsa sp.]|jgi:hypothetical protein